MTSGDPLDGGAPAVSRRHLLGGLAAGGLAGALAGCTSDGGSTPPPEIGDSRTTLGRAFQYFTEDAQLNPWAANYPYSVAGLLFAVPAVVVPGEGWRPLDLLDGLDVDGTTVTVRYDDAFEWWNGRAVTARDRWVAARIQTYVGGSPALAAELVDEYTVRYEFEQPLARERIRRMVAVGAHNTPSWYFDPWRERFADASSEAARAAVRSDLHDLNVSLEEAMEEGFGCGPYELTEVSINRLLLERFDGYPGSESLPIPRLWLPVSGTSTSAPALADGSIDVGTGVVNEGPGEPPENIEQLARFHTTEGTKLTLNWRNDHLARRNVRRALVAAAPLDAVVASALWGDAATVQTGMTRPPQRRWLDEDVRSQLYRYPVESDTELAATFMRRAGYERRGGTWHDPEGAAASLRLLSPLFEGWPGAMQALSQSLSSFGFDVSFRSMDNTQFLIAVEDAQHDVAPYWASGRPAAAYDVTADVPSSIGYGVTDPDRERSPLEKPLRPRVPERPGDLQASAADTRTVDLLDLWHRIGRQTDAATKRAAIATIATWWNYDLPDVDVGTHVTGVWGNVRDFEWPDRSDWRYRALGPSDSPEFHLLRTGAVSPGDG